jgi:hypothetical protein
VTRLRFPHLALPLILVGVWLGIFPSAHADNPIPSDATPGILVSTEQDPIAPGPFPAETVVFKIASN